MSQFSKSSIKPGAGAEGGVPVAEPRAIPCTGTCHLLLNLSVTLVPAGSHQHLHAAVLPQMSSSGSPAPLAPFNDRAAPEQALKQSVECIFLLSTSRSGLCLHNKVPHSLKRFVIAITPSFG